MKDQNMHSSGHNDVPTDGLRLYPRILVIFTITLATAASSMSTSIVNVALPNMAQALNIEPGYSVAIVSAFQIAMIASLLPLAGLGEIIGYRKVYLPGLIIFALASFMISVAHGVIDAILWRFVQGLGAAGVLSVNTAILRFVYPKRHFGRGLGLNAFVAGTSMALGPPVAAAILSFSSWHWLFLVNVPLCITAFAIGFWAIPNTAKGMHKLSLVSITYHVSAFTLVTCGLNFKAMNISLGHASAMVMIGLFLAVLYVRRELRRKIPLIPMDLFKIQDFRSSVFASICAFSAQILVLTILPFWLEHTAERTAGEIGWLLAGWPASSMFAALISGALLERIPATQLSVIGQCLFGIGVSILIFLSPESSSYVITAAMVLCGVGFGLFQTPNNRLMLSSAPPSRSGSASGSLGTARVVGQSLGSAGAAILLMTDFNLALHLSGAIAAVLALLTGMFCLRKRVIHRDTTNTTSILSELKTMHQSIKPEVIMLQYSPNYLALLKQYAVVHDASKGLDKLSNEVLSRVRYVVTTGFTGVSAAQMKLLPSLRLICCSGTGFENVDLEAARSHGVFVSHGAGNNAPAVADQAIALLLNVVRGITEQDGKAREGVWRSLLTPYPMVAGKKIGIFGMGKIGEAIAKRAIGFDLEVYYHSRTQKPQLPYAFKSSLAALAEEVDFLICCAPGGKETFHAVNSNILQLLGSEGYLVNVGRGSLVDTEALVMALESNTIKGAALDVYETEPTIPEALRQSDKTVLTLHTAGVSHETQRSGIALIMRNISGLEQDGVPVSPIPPMAKDLFSAIKPSSAF
ncbi:MFS transporter (plasmid) [Pantoea sp. C3]|uniref:MFS transporter n=1 Tax=Pantoea phytostimulans TaxID=2769024 RepID=UPI0038F647A4